MSKIAFLFPGQGGQFIGQGKTWFETYPVVKDLFNLADEVCGRSISNICFAGPLELLNQTINLQPAVAVVSLAALVILRQKGFKPDFTAGHSLGELAALCAAGVIDEETVLKLVAKRAQLMETCTKENPGSMAAILRLSAKEVESICELARAQGVVVAANFNTPEQTVISGASDAVATAVRFAKAKGGRVLPLPVSGAFHSLLMEKAGLAFSEILDEVEFKKANCPVVQNVSGSGETDPKILKENLKKQITSPVKWTASIEYMFEKGVVNYIEAWPKAYILNLVKKSLKEPAEKLISTSEIEEF